MPMLGNETERDAMIEEKDLVQAQREIGYGKRIFGPWALMRSSMSAENREARRVARKRRSLERGEKRLDAARRMREFTRRIIVRMNY